MLHAFSERTDHAKLPTDQHDRVRTEAEEETRRTFVQSTQWGQKKDKER